MLSVSMCEGVSQSASAKLCLCLCDSVSVKPTGFTASLIRALGLSLSSRESSLWSSVPETLSPRGRW